MGFTPLNPSYALQPSNMNVSSSALSRTPALRLFRPDHPTVALGLAVNHLMTKPAFANLRFGDWSRILVGQINRRHYYFAVDGNNKIQGFIGWALTTKENAEAWVEGRRALSFADSLEGDCLVFNAWAANSTKVHRYLVDEARKIISDKQVVYFKRYYNDGSTRPVRLSVNDFVMGHISRQGSAPAAVPSSSARDLPTTSSPNTAIPLSPRS
jgi:hemolysin-activating ACP:hemolysin acyltransferase